MGLWYNIVQILPDNLLEYSHSVVSSVRAPISLGIGPAEEFKIAVQLVRDMSVNGAIVNGTNNLPVRALWFKYNIVNFVNCPISAGIAPTKITR